MKVGKIGHASLLIAHGRVRALMDPVFEPAFSSGTNVFEPPVEVDAEALCGMANMVVISHAHLDHFSPHTLNRVRRSVPVFYPEGDGQIARVLDRLGFERPMPVRAGQQISLGGLCMYPTASAVGFPEMGMVFTAGTASFWNSVDSNPSEDAIALVREIVGRPTLLFAKYQPLLESELECNALGADFPFAAYGAMLRDVWRVNPRWVAPASCGFRFRRGWLNERAFPITEEQFLLDVKAAGPEIETLQVPHGACVEIGTRVRFAAGLDQVRRLTPRERAGYDWRPERGVPSLTDEPTGPAVRLLRAEVDRYLSKRFLEDLARADAPWQEKMRRLRACWCLEVVYSDGSCDLRELRFSTEPYRWSRPTPGAFYHLRTSVPAFTLCQALRAEITSYAFSLDARRMHRLYEVHRGGVTAASRPEDCPLTRLLHQDLDDRYLEREVDAILRDGERQKAVG